MATKKISELVTATELEGDDVLPVVQDGVTKKASVDLLTREGSLVKIAEQTLSVAGPTIDFQNIPQEFDSLFVRCALRTTQAAVFGGVSLSINGDNSDANYFFQQMRGYQATAVAQEFMGVAGSRNIALVPGASAIVGTYGSLDLEFPYYAKVRPQLYSGANRGFWSTATGGALVRDIAVGRNVSEAINRITLTPTAVANFAASSKASLYGLRSAFG